MQVIGFVTLAKTYTDAKIKLYIDEKEQDMLKHTYTHLLS